MWVLPIAHGTVFEELQTKNLRERVVFGVCAEEIVRDNAVVARGLGKCGGREAPPRSRRDTVICPQFRDYRRVLVRIDNDCHRFVIFGCGPDHGRPTNIDIFDCRFTGRIRRRDGLFERIKVHDNEINGGNACLGHGRLINAAATQNTTMNMRM